MSVLERELKFDAAPDDVMPSFEDLGASHTHEITLAATYWDTDDRRLMTWGCSLRHRSASDGSEPGWTLKIPAARDHGDLVARHEVTSDAPAGEPPNDLLALVHTVLLGDTVRPVATITTRRSIIELTGVGGAANVQLSDDHVESEVDGRPGPTFREIEAEMQGAGSTGLLDEVRSRLDEAGLAPSAIRSKVQRVLGPRPSLLAAPKRLPPDASVHEFLVATIGTSTRQLMINDPGVRLGEDVEAIHQARVATRRLRSDLKTFAALLDEGAVAHVRAELAWLGDLLGQVRDPQVLEHRLAAQAAEMDEAVDGIQVAQITERLTERAEFRHSMLVDAMGGDRYLSLIAELLKLANDPPVASRKTATRSAAPIAERLARKQWKRARRFAGHLADHPTDVELHNVRKRLKRVRYASQSVRRLRLGDKHFRRELADLQDRLGDLHDLVVQTEFLATDVERLGPEAAFLAGRLLQDTGDRRRALRAEWPTIAERLRRLD